MLNPDVTEILDDPEVGGGVSFTVKRTTTSRTWNAITRAQVESHSTQTFSATGNIQPQTKNLQPSTSEDLLNESIVVRSTFIFQSGSNDGLTFIGPDEIYYNGHWWRVTQIENWQDWGFTAAYASRVMDKPTSNS